MFLTHKNLRSIFSFKDISKARFQQGTSLIEVIVALLILGVGLLGVLSLQANSLSSHHRANFVTDAQILAQDMADRILASASTASSSTTANLVRNGSYDGITIVKGTAESGAACTVASPCDSGSARSFNQDEWLQSLNESSLPRGRAVVEWNQPVYRIEVMWDQDRDPLLASVPVTCAANNCFRMEVRLP